MSKHSLKIFISFLVLITLFASCAPGDTSKTSQLDRPVPIAQPAEKEVGEGKDRAWRVEWEKVLTGAQKEGKVVIYANLGKDVLEAWRKGFKNKFNLDIEALAGRSTELAEKALSERRAGLYLVDTFIGGATTSMSLKRQKATASSQSLLILPEVTDPKVWWEGKLPFLDKEGHIFAFRASPNTPFIVNTQLVRPSEIKGYKDLLNPKWKAKIIMNDPSVAGSGHDIFYLVARNIYDMDFWREMVKLEPVISRDQRLPVEWVARNKYAVGIGLKADVITEFALAGAPIESVTPVEGTYITPGAGTFLLMDSAPHAQAAKVFANWLLSREGLELMSRAQMVQSARVDLPTDFLPKEERRDPRAKYFSQHTEEIILEKEKYFEIAREIFAPVMK